MVKHWKKLLLLILLASSQTAYSANSYSVDLERSTSDYAGVSNNLGVDGGVISFGGWFKAEVDMDDANTYGILFQSSSGTDTGYHLRVSAGSLRCERERLNVANTVISYDANFDTNWHHAVCIYDGTNLKLYYDNSLVAGPTAASGVGSGATASCFVVGSYDSTSGGSCTYNSSTFDGLVDDVIVYNVDLSSQVTTNYTTPCSPYTTGDVARYEFENAYTDSVGGFTLTTNGSPVFSGTTAYTCSSGGLGSSGSWTWPSGTATTSATSTEAILINGFLSIVFGIAIIIFLLMLFVSGYLYNNIIKPIYDR